MKTNAEKSELIAAVNTSDKMQFKRKVWLLISGVLACSFLLVSCKHPSNCVKTHVENTPKMLRPWTHPPGISLEEALAKATNYLREQQQNVSGGYILEAARGEYNGEDCWWFVFKLLPRSPGSEINVRVFDSGRVNAFPLAPRRNQNSSPI